MRLEEGPHLNVVSRGEALAKEPERRSQREEEDQESGATQAKGRAFYGDSDQQCQSFPKATVKQGTKTVP